MCVCVIIHAFISQLNLWWGPRSNGNPVALSPTNTRTLVSKHHFPIKGTRTPWTSGSFKAGVWITRWIWDTWNHKGRMCLKNGWGHVKRSKEPTWRRSQWSKLEEFEQQNDSLELPHRKNKNSWFHKHKEITECITKREWRNSSSLQNNPN